ncbi:4Fe-4S binding protein [Leptolyngbya sp. AN02str]|uniref:4Fe-4S binding protein n=1 Tax=Leptolyngbya sp. AN02str TaxID=3423363 RepID=UPI003D31E826
MIELVSQSRCIECNLCVSVCPTNVFDAVPGAPPVIARQSDCQTCYMCEVYCPVDALYVAPNADESVQVNEAELAESGLLGSYRRIVGWGQGRIPGAAIDTGYYTHRHLAELIQQTN